MLNSILIENFKSYKSARLPLAPLTLMIGANASGKTNAIEAFRFLSWVVGGEKLSTIKNRINDSERIFRGDVRDLVYKGETAYGLGLELDQPQVRYGIHIRLHDSNLDIEYEKMDFLRELHPSIVVNRGTQPVLNRPKTEDEKLQEAILAGGLTATITKALFPETPAALWGTLAGLYVLGNSNNQKPSIPLEPSNQVTFLDQVKLVIQQRPNQNSEEAVNAASKIQQTLEQVFFFDLLPSAMRADSLPENRLRNTGANLAGVLYTLWQDTDQQAHILAFIQSLPEQDIKALKFYTDHRGRVELALIETFGNQDQEQHIELLSDGTLRVLAIAAALLSAPEGSTIVIEEVDNGVHPSRAKQLLTTMREHAKRRGLRLLLSTHNPALMDALPDEALGDVVFCYRDPKDGDSRLVRLSDLDDYMGLVMQGSLGQLVTRGVVDRFVKNPVTPEQQKQNALEWLAKLRGEV